MNFLATMLNLKGQPVKDNPRFLRIWKEIGTVLQKQVHLALFWRHWILLPKVNKGNTVKCEKAWLPRRIDGKLDLSECWVLEHLEGNVPRVLGAELVPELFFIKFKQGLPVYE